MDDPTIQLRASVGDIAFIRRLHRSSFEGQRVKGAMYIQDGALIYRLACGKRFCCEFCNKSYPLTEVKAVEVLINQMAPIASSNGRYICWHVQSGLKITIKDGTTILVKMEDASHFGPGLMKVCGLLNDVDF